MPQLYRTLNGPF